jgi:hypothetical protein
MKKILHLINNDHDGIFHYVNKLINSSLKNHSNIILSKYSSSKKVINLDSGKSLTEFLYDPILILKNQKEFYLKLLNKIKRDFFNFYLNSDVLFNYYFNRIDFSKLKTKIIKFDVIFIYTFREILSPKDLKMINDFFKCKIIFYPLDFELLSGGFHFENYNKNNLKLQKRNKELICYKKKNISKLNIHWIAANKYIQKKIKSSTIYNINNHKISKIYNTYEKFNFSKHEILNFKKKNNLKKFDLIMLFSSLKLSDKRKGLTELKNCLENYEKSANNNHKIAIISLGKEKNVNLGNRKIKHFHFDYIKDLRKLNLLFCSCDIFLNLTKYDFGPILCEIAFQNNLFILSSNVGIANEIVVNNHNGFIYKNNDELHKKFQMIINLAIRKKKIRNNQFHKMRNIYALNKSKEFNKIFNEKFL